MRPVDLPAVRAAMSRPRSVRDAADWIRPRQPDTTMALQQALREAALYWVSSEMALLASEVARHEIDEARWLLIDRPTPAGLFVIEHLPAEQDTSTSVEFAVSWGDHPDGLLLVWWADRDGMAEYRDRLPRHPAPLISTGGFVVPVNERYQPLTEYPRLRRNAIALLQAMWLLMDMPSITTTACAGSSLPTFLADRVPRPRRATARSGTAGEDVAVIHIRRERPGRASGSAASPYRHRWVVRPHKRWQACGPGRRQRRRVLVPPHIKGPAGAPFLNREHVMLWDR
ncbi:hypothetical protein [Saccharopolyspora griseoalba]|uniref:Uncharacterized protein n=1 Tax=Saccharopolyspora griseoalba TaxID=1431848 RepID=A0ABW2LQU1_9PSEU